MEYLNRLQELWQMLASLQGARAIATESKDLEELDMTISETLGRIHELQRIYRSRG
jgi:hypothetical protein